MESPKRNILFFLVQIKNNYNFIERKKNSIHSYKQGPYSEIIAGEEETLIRDGYLEVLDPESKNLPVRSTIKGNSEFLSDLKLDEKS